MDLQPGAASHKSVIKDIFRVEEPVAAKLLMQSSRPADNQGWFAEKMDHCQLNLLTKILQRNGLTTMQDDEGNAAYATPVAKPASQLRVAREGRQSGVRRIASRTSHLAAAHPGVPRD